MDVSILEGFVIPNLEERFGDSDIICMNGSASDNSYRIGKVYLFENNVPRMKLLSSIPEVNPIKIYDCIYVTTKINRRTIRLNETTWGKHRSN